MSSFQHFKSPSKYSRYCDGCPTNIVHTEIVFLYWTSFPVYLPDREKILFSLPELSRLLWFHNREKLRTNKNPYIEVRNSDEAKNVIVLGICGWSDDH